MASNNSKETPEVGTLIWRPVTRSESGYGFELNDWTYDGGDSMFGTGDDGTPLMRARPATPNALQEPTYWRALGHKHPGLVCFFDGWTVEALDDTEWTIARVTEAHATCVGVEPLQADTSHNIITERGQLFWSQRLGGDDLLYLHEVLVDRSGLVWYNKGWQIKSLNGGLPMFQHDDRIRIDDAIRDRIRRHLADLDGVDAVDAVKARLRRYGFRSEALASVAWKDLECADDHLRWRHETSTQLRDRLLEAGHPSDIETADEAYQLGRMRAIETLERICLDPDETGSPLRKGPRPSDWRALLNRMSQDQSDHSKEYFDRFRDGFGDVFDRIIEAMDLPS